MRFVLDRAGALARHQVFKASTIRVAALVLGVAASVATARLGGTEVKGVSSAYAATVGLVFLFWNFDLAQQALRSGRDQGKLGAVLPWLKKAWRWYFLIAGVFVLVGIVTDVSVIWLALGTCASLIITQAAIAATGLRGPTVAAVGGVAQQAAMLIGVLVLYQVNSLDVQTVRLVVVVSYLAPLPLFWRNGWEHRTSKTSKEALEESLPRMLKKGAPWQAVRSIQTLLIKLDLPVVFAITGSAAAGFYSVGISTAMLVNLVPRQMSNNTLFLLLNGRRVDPSAAALRAVLIGSGLAAVLALAAPWLIPLIYGADFEPAIKIIYLALPGTCAYGAVQVQANYIRIVGKKHHMLGATVGGLVVMSTALVTLVPRFGGSGGAIAYSSGLVAAAVCGYIICRRLNREHQQTETRSITDM